MEGGKHTLAYVCIYAPILHFDAFALPLFRFQRLFLHKSRQIHINTSLHIVYVWMSTLMHMQVARKAKRQPVSRHSSKFCKHTDICKSPWRSGDEPPYCLRSAPPTLGRHTFALCTRIYYNKLFHLSDCCETFLTLPLFLYAYYYCC